MTTLVLTVVGSDRSGIVAAVADVVAAHGGNWETSELAELAGAFAGIVEVSVPADRADALRAALSGLEGLHTVAVQAGVEVSASPRQSLVLRVLGNDHPGIVRELSAALSAHGVSIDRMTTETRDAAMAGGRLFEATVVAAAPVDVDVAAVAAEIERLAAEIQVDITLG
ncbi:glycine cleavage system protein R [Microbacterium sp. SSM24]|uniref:glycine cleavage system protein R n=1 Tax=Microbacterium sp. SSM24 TaxID=2991714 RepID=UPI002225D937|nr:ACT domain-containing protein [Microbacterium sp. SSM24]MCW3492762.1 ACT domain-containing protein [Microbacterium sp. SSM24]